MDAIFLEFHLSGISLKARNIELCAHLVIHFKEGTTSQTGMPHGANSSCIKVLYARTSSLVSAELKMRVLQECAYFRPMVLGIVVLNTGPSKDWRCCFSASLDTIVRSENVHRTPMTSGSGLSWVCLPSQTFPSAVQITSTAAPHFWLGTNYPWLKTKYLATL